MKSNIEENRIVPKQNAGPLETFLRSTVWKSSVWTTLDRWLYVWWWNFIQSHFYFYCKLQIKSVNYGPSNVLIQFLNNLLWWQDENIAVLVVDYSKINVPGFNGL
jgi:hypothetical protein